MINVHDYLEDITTFESICSSFEWKGNSLILYFDSGIDLGVDSHSVLASFGYDEPCKFIYEDVIFSKLKVAELIAEPNHFKEYFFIERGAEGDIIPPSYNEYYMEGQMNATNPQGWFTWDLVAKTVYFDDLKGS